MLKASPIRSLLAGIIIAASLLAYLEVRQYWPSIFEHARKAILFYGLALSLFILRPGLQAWPRTITGLLAIVALAIASVLALTEPVQIIGRIFSTMVTWKASGLPITSLGRAASSYFYGLSSQQRLAFYTGLWLGLPLPVFMSFWIIGKLTSKTNNRVTKSGPWRSQWLSWREVMQLKHNAQGLPLGLTKGAILRYRPDPNRGWRAGHHAAIAGTRAGKGVSVVIPAILDHEGSVIVLDIKGENFVITRKHRLSLGRKVIVLNPFGIHEPMKHRFNPLDYIRRDHLVRDIDVIAEGLVRPEGGAGSHFAEMAKSVVAATIEVVVSQDDQPDLLKVMDILFSPQLHDTLNSWANDPAKYGTRAAQTASTFLAAGENEQGGIRTTMKKSLDWARSDEMRRFLQDTNCSLDEVFADRADLFIVVPLDQVDAQGIFLRLLTNIILGMAVRQEGRRRSKHNILFVLDEFVRLGRMEKLLSIANVAAGAGIEALFITQDKGQIESVYGKGDTASLLGSCATIRIFGLGRAESETANWAAEALGDQTILTRTTTTAKSFNDRPSTSTSEQRQKLMTADQILEMPPREMLVLMGSRRPVKLRAIISHRHVSYKRKLMPNPILR